MKLILCFVFVIIEIIRVNSEIVANTQEKLQNEEKNDVNNKRDGSLAILIRTKNSKRGGSIAGIIGGQQKRDGPTGIAGPGVFVPILPKGKDRLNVLRRGGSFNDIIGGKRDISPINCEDLVTGDLENAKLDSNKLRVEKKRGGSRDGIIGGKRGILPVRCRSAKSDSDTLINVHKRGGSRAGIIGAKRDNYFYKRYIANLVEGYRN